MNILNHHKVVGIFGLAKNTGKTTSLNALIETYKDDVIALTSIGLDGEDYDQLSFLPKPKILAYPNFIIATAKETLKNLKNYTIIEETPHLTSLGNIVIIRIHQKQHVLLAGPTTNKALNDIALKLKKLATFTIIDGALNRKTFTQIKAIDGLILATGASVASRFEETIEITLNTVYLYTLPTSHLKISKHSEVVHVHEDKAKEYNHKNTLEHIISKLKENDSLFIKGAITDRIIDSIIARNMKNIELVAVDASKYLFNVKKVKYLKALNIQLNVLHQIPLIAITINPWHPQGLHYDEKEFKETLKKHTQIPIFNVLERN